MTAPRLVFVDVETTGLDTATHEIWEAAFIDRRSEFSDGRWQAVDHETRLFIKPTKLQAADPAALQISRFYERTHHLADNSAAGKPASSDAPKPAPGEHWTSPRAAATRIARLTANAVLVGSNPAFDAAMLARLIRSAELVPAWHYRPVCVATMAYGYQHGAVANYNQAIAEEATEAGREVDEAELERVPDSALHAKFASYALSRECGVEPPAGDDAHTALADARWVRDWYDALIRGAA